MSNDATDPLSSSEMLEGLNLKALLASGLSAGDTSEPIPKLPGYEVIERIGRGGMGSVYLARQLSLDRLVAVKVISVDQSIIEGQREILLNRLESEARVMAKLNHPNLVSVYDFVKREDGGAAIVMELVSNGNIREQYFSQNTIPVSAEKVATVGEQVASCLQAAHSVGVIHRDIKPENLLVDEKGEVKVSDFGLALDSESIRLTASGMSVGTLGYSSPEQLEGLETDERADLYSLGVVMYELLTGRKPMGDVKRPSSLRSGVPGWLEQVIIDALQPERNQRIKSAAEFKVRLEKGRTNGSKQKTPRRPVRNWRSLAWGIATACVLLLGGWMISKNLPATQSKSVLEHSTVIQGNYEKVAEGLRTYPGTPCFFGVSETPSVIGKTIRVEFTRISGATPIAIFFKHPQGFGSVLLDAWRQGDSGVEAINDETLKTSTNKFTFFIENERSYVFEARFEKDRIITSVDGIVMQDLVIANERLSIANDWNWPTSKIGDYTFVVGTFKNETIIHNVTIDGLPL